MSTVLDSKINAEIKQTLDCVEVGTSKPTVFVSTAQRDVRYDTPGTGDIDYARSIVNHVNLLEPNSAELIKALYKEEAIYKYVLEQTSSPTLHIMLNPPFTGMVFTPEGIKGFKQRGGKVIITAIEFAKFAGREEEYQTKYNVHPQNTILKFLTCADGVIFLDENDRQMAANYFHQSLFGGSSHIEKILSGARVIPVLPTILPMTKPLVERGKDIISFGIIRNGKGFGLVVELAKEFKRIGNDKKVLVVGTVLDTEDGLYQLQRLMEAVYPSKKDEIYGATSATILKKKLEGYKKTLVSDLPLEIHTDVQKADLPALFNRCTYAFLPAYRGATLRNSSISSSIAQGFIVYTHAEDITPSVLLEGGTYEGAVVLKKFEPNKNQGGASGRQYVFSVLQDILERDKDPSLNTPNLKAMEKLLQGVLSTEAIAQAHSDLYSSVRQTPLSIDSSTSSEVTSVSEDEPMTTFVSSQLGSEFPYYVHHFRALMQAKRAYRQFGKTHGFDVEKQARLNFSELVRKLGTLTEEERDFVGSVLAGDWYLTHATKSYDKIKKEKHTLLSLRERIRHSGDTRNRNTNYGEGNDDNVFFAFGPGKISSPEFLKDAGHVIEIDFNKGLQKKRQRKTHGLTGVWTSGHAYAFLTEQYCTPMVIHGTRVSVRYEKIDPKGPVTTKNLHKIYRFEYRDSGGALIQAEEELRLQDEIFLVRHMKAALVLMTIGKLRKLGPTAWQAIMQERDLTHRQQIIQELFHVGVFEAHKPGFLSLDEQDYITVKERPKLAQSSFSVNLQSLESDNARQAILAGDADSARRLIEGDNRILGSTVGLGTDSISLSLFDLAVITRSDELVTWCLKSGNPVLREKQSVHRYISTTVQEKQIYDTLITPILLLASPNVKDWLKYDKAEQDTKRFREYLELVTQQGVSAADRPHFKHPYVITEVDIQNAITFELPIAEICFLVSLARDIHPRRLPLRLAVTTGSHELVELMLKMGADVNQALTFVQEMDKQIEGSTPLLQAIVKKNDSIIDLLLRQEGIDINRPWEAAGEFSGYTPLMLAAEQGLESVVSQLLDKGAKVGCLNAKGKTVLDIARDKGFDNIVKMLSQATSHSEALSDWEKLALATPHHVRAGFVLLGSDTQGRLKVLVQDKQFLLEEVIRYFPFDPSTRDDFTGSPKIKVVNKGKLLECGFQHGPSHTYYGYQLQFLELSAESLAFIQAEMLDLFSVEDLQTLQVKANGPGRFSSLEKTVVTHLKKETGGRICIEDNGQKPVEEALKAYLSAVIKFRQAIDTRDMKAVQEFLEAYPSLDLETLVLPGKYPASAYDNQPDREVCAMPLANSVGFTEGTLVFLKSGRIEPQDHNFYDLFQAIVRQDDLETFLEAIGQSSDLRVASPSIPTGWGKRQFEDLSSYTLAQWISEQSVVTDKITGWLSQHKKEILNLDYILMHGIRSLSVQCVEHWISQAKKTSSLYYLADALENIKGRPLTHQEQDRFLQILTQLVDDSTVDELPYFIQRIVKYLSGGQEEFLGKVLLLSVKNLKVEQRKKLITTLTYTDLKDFNTKAKAAFYDSLTTLLATVETDEYLWIISAIARKNVELFGVLLEKGNFNVKDISSICWQVDILKNDLPILQSMLETLIITFALNPENAIASSMVKYFEERHFFSKEFVELFNKLMAEKDQLKERALKAREQAKAPHSEPEAPSSKPGDPGIDSSKVLTQTLCNHLLDLAESLNSKEKDEKVKKEGTFRNLVNKITRIIESGPSFDEASVQTISGLLKGLPSDIGIIGELIQNVKAAISRPIPREGSLSAEGQTSSSSTSLGGAPLLFSFGQTTLTQQLTHLSASSSSSSFSSSSLNFSTSCSSSGLSSGLSTTTCTPLQSSLSFVSSTLDMEHNDKSVSSTAESIQVKKALFDAVRAGEIETVKGIIKKLKLEDQNIEEPGSRRTLCEVLLDLTDSERMQEVVEKAIKKNLEPEEGPVFDIEWEEPEQTQTDQANGWGDDEEGEQEKRTSKEKTSFKMKK